MGGNAEKRKHGEMLPSTIRAIICGPSNCGKSNVLISLLQTAYVSRMSTSIRNRCNSQSIDISKIYLCLSMKSAILRSATTAIVVPPSEACPNSIFIFDDVACDRQDAVREYFSMGHANVDCFYLCQTYARIPKHLIATTRTCWSCSNRIVPTWNTFTTITWIPTCTMNFVCCVAIVGKKNMNF